MRTLRFLVLATLALSAVPAAADKADREKEINIGADRSVGDDNTGVLVLDGNVVVTQGTMRVTAAKVTVKRDPENYKFYVANGSPVTFRQKRDKADDYIEGWAQRAEFDDKTAKLKLFDQARLKSAQGEITGDVITYDTERELFEVSGNAQPGAASSRVKATLIPQKKEPGKDGKADAKAPPPPTPLQLKPDTSPAVR